LPKPPKSQFLAHACIVSLVASISYAHPGGRDADGGHVNRSTGDYHCHAVDCAGPGSDPVEEKVENPAEATIARSWVKTKQWARDIIYAEHSETLYCGCDYVPMGRSGGTIDLSSCGFELNEESNSARANRLEWEHVVPASLMPARDFDCWTVGLADCDERGRQCCEDHDEEARAMIFDLHNLVPSVGQTNALRSNKRYGVIDGEDLLLGNCDFEWSGELVEPNEKIRGNVARIWLYFSTRHGLHLEGSELAMYHKWSTEDPPEEWEFVRNDRIRAKQGNGNAFVELFPRK